MFTPYINECLLWHNDCASANFKQQPSDFIVDEILNWDFCGHGEHLFLRVEKTGCNTVWIAKQLARFYGVPPRDVGYSGLKDRHAITTQYFSVRLPGVKLGAYDIPTHDEYRVVEHHLHDKKLKRGNHKFNDFTIRLTDVRGDKAIIEQRLQWITDNGCPNFFDSQRFGNDNSNLVRLQQWLDGDIDVRKRNEKSLLLSALRAALFNQQLGERVQNGTWNTMVTGDIAMLHGSHSHFVPDAIDTEMLARAKEKDIHPAGRLIGENSALIQANPKLHDLLKRERVIESYRPLRVVVQNLNWTWAGADDALTIRFRLPAGAYASGVLRHLLAISM